MKLDSRVKVKYHDTYILENDSKHSIAPVFKVVYVV